MNWTDVKIGMIARMNCDYGPSLSGNLSRFKKGDLVKVDRVWQGDHTIFAIRLLLNPECIGIMYCKRFDPI